jgi:hypothetical protein
MIKPQPEHDPETLARVQRVAPGAQSEYGRVLLSKSPWTGRAQRSHFVMGPRAVLKPDLPPAVTRRRWNG